ncbi:hypothetical protein ACET3Z_001586 [Daucus carota]
MANLTLLPDSYSELSSQAGVTFQLCDEYSNVILQFRKNGATNLMKKNKNCRNPFAEDPSGLPERTNEAAGAYAKACASVAEEYKIPVINLWNRMQKFPNWEKLMLSLSTNNSSKLVTLSIINKVISGGLLHEIKCVQPTPLHITIEEYISSEKFSFWKDYGESIGFRHLATGLLCLVPDPDLKKETGRENAQLQFFYGGVLYNRLTATNLMKKNKNCRNPFAEDPSGLPERTNEAAGAYAKACASVAEEYKIPVINLWNRMQKFPNWEKLMLSLSTNNSSKLVTLSIINKVISGGLLHEIKCVQPTPLHITIEEYISSEKFSFWKDYGESIGFRHLATGLLCLVPDPDLKKETGRENAQLQFFYGGVLYNRLTATNLMKKNKNCRNPFAEDPSGLPERTNEAAGAYAKACASVAEEYKIPVINLWNRMQKFPNWEKLMLSLSTNNSSKLVTLSIINKVISGGLLHEIKCVQPTPLHITIEEYISSEKFSFWKDYGESIGFRHLATGLLCLVPDPDLKKETGRENAQLQFFYGGVLYNRLTATNLMKKNKNCRNPFAEDPSGLPERTNEAAGAYAKACASVAEEYKIPVINLWNRMQKFPNWEKLMLSLSTNNSSKLVTLSIINKVISGGLLHEIKCVQPTPLHITIEEYISSEKFSFWKDYGESIGFRHLATGLLCLVPDPDLKKETGRENAQLQFFYGGVLYNRLTATNLMKKNKNCRNPFAEDPSGLPERTNEAAGAYAKACASVAEEYKIPVINLWNRMQKFPNWEKLMLSLSTNNSSKLVTLSIINKVISGGLLHEIKCVQPTPLHITIEEYISSEKFSFWKDYGESIGFRHLATGLLTRLRTIFDLGMLNLFDLFAQLAHESEMAIPLIAAATTREVDVIGILRCRNTWPLYIVLLSTLNYLSIF